MTADPKKTRRLPLKGVRVLVGRARHQAGALSSGLRFLGARVVEIPFIEVRKPRSYAPLDSALQQLEGYDWLILTSVNGVEALWDRAVKLSIPKKQFSHLKLAAIGPATKRSLLEHGFKVHVVPKEYVAESVVASLRGRVKGRRVLLARARVARDVIPRELRKLGAQVDVVEAYETIVPRASAARIKKLLKSRASRPQVITFTSSSTARNLVELLGGKPSRGPAGRSIARMLEGICLASIGPVTSSSLRKLGLRADVEAREYTIPGLTAAIAAHDFAN